MRSSWIGTDESGKGDYFGPLVVAGVLVEKENVSKLIDFGVKDSKKINDVTIEKIAEKISAILLNGEDVVYAVPGSPNIAEKTVELLKQKAEKRCDE